MAEKFGIDGIEVWHGELPAKERREALRLAMEYDLYVSGGDDHSSLLGGQYYRFEHPEETKYFFPARSLGTTQYFFEEIRDKKKKPDRKKVMQELLDNDELWQKTGGITDNL
jgi:sugar phosphate isomerase/epimerase